MTEKALKSKAISIKGKEYVQVKDRVIYFNEEYPNGMIQTQILSESGDRVVVSAKVTPDYTKPERFFTGISASNPSKTIEKQVPHEVAETSAVGRALAMMGIGVIDSIASVEEMKKATQKTEPVSGLKMTCKIHNEAMHEYMSKKTNRPFFAHKINDEWCFGREK